MAVALPYEAFELSEWARRLGLEDPLPYVRDLTLVDTDALRNVGRDVWGVSLAHPALHSAGYSSAAQLDLEALARELRAHRNSELSPYWNGIAFDAFQEHAQRIVQRMEETASHLTTVGDVLVSIADEFELRLLEVIGYIVSAAGVVLSATGVATTVTTWWTGIGAVAGVVAAVIGLVVSVAGLAITHLSVSESRLDELSLAIERLSGVVPPGRWVEPQAE